MQSVDKNGFFGKVQELDPKELNKLLHDEKIDHVDVFMGTEENIKKRQKLEGKKFNPFGHKLSPGFKKARPSKKT